MTVLVVVKPETYDQEAYAKESKSHKHIYEPDLNP